MRTRFLPDVEDRLRAAGWCPGRLLADEELESLDEEKPLFLAAQRAIEEFGGLYVESQGEWRHSPNYRRSFYIGPWMLMGDDQLIWCERSMKRRLYPLGFIDYSFETKEEDGREYAMFIDEVGRVFAFHHFTGDMGMLIGLTIDQALNNLGTEKGFRLWDFANDVPLEAPYLFTDWWKQPE